MTIAVDTSVLVDVIRGDPRFGPASRDALAGALTSGRVVACDVVWAEVVAGVDDDVTVVSLLRQLPLEFVPMSEDAAREAGRAWRAYRAAGGQRSRIIGDFLIGAHALAHADALLTRDRGVHRTYYPGLLVIDPSAG
ncbi:MAG: type II toxin-antitoxin system VapC family toxin [Chloroflexi bacterium]|nr:type II toxin-antitoxin system VapC family toxin [Chloroflexota bacterium]